jgi:hypothetical protein
MNAIFLFLQNGITVLIGSFSQTSANGGKRSDACSYLNPVEKDFWRFESITFCRDGSNFGKSRPWDARAFSVSMLRHKRKENLPHPQSLLSYAPARRVRFFEGRAPAIAGPQGG